MRSGLIVTAALVISAAAGFALPLAARGQARTDLYSLACSGGLSVERAGSVSSPLLDEISGVAASRRHAGVLWVHNDSGDAARVYAIDIRGRLLARVEIEGATARDWEDIAVGPGPAPRIAYLFVGDIGDNDKRRSEIVVYRFPEPSLGTRPVRADRLALRYPDGPHDAEALLVDPRDGSLLVLTKVIGAASVYRAARPGRGPQTLALSRVGRVPGLAPVTGASVSPSGRVVAVRTYLGISLWERTPGRPLWSAFRRRPCPAPAPVERQGEAIAFARGGSRLYTIGEGRSPAIDEMHPG